mgnify:CR=1 FL=1
MNSLQTTIEQAWENRALLQEQDTRIIEIAKSHLREVRKQHRKLEEKVGLLEEKLNNYIQKLNEFYT